MYLADRAAPARGALPGDRRPRGAPAITGVVLALGAVSLITDVSSEMVTAVLPLYLVAGLGISPLGFGTLDGLYNGVSALVQLTGGHLADRVRDHKLVAGAGYALSAVCKPLLLLAHSVGPLGVVLALERTGKGLRTSPRDALISLSAPAGTRGRAFGVHRAMDTTGAVLGPVAAFLILRAAADGYDAVFGVSACVAALGVLVLVLFVPGGDAATRPRAAGGRTTPQGRAPGHGARWGNASAATARAHDAPGPPLVGPTAGSPASVGVPVRPGAPVLPHRPARPGVPAGPVVPDEGADTAPVRPDRPAPADGPEPVDGPGRPSTPTPAGPRVPAGDAGSPVPAAEPVSVPADDPRAPGPSGAPDADARAGGEPAPPAGLRDALALLRVPRLRALAACAVLLGLTTVSDAFVYLLLQRRTGLGEQWFPLLPLGTSAVFLLLAVPAGMLADRIGRRVVFLAGHAALLGGYALLLWAPVTGTLPYLVLTLHGVFYAATDGVLPAAVADVVPERLRGSGLALVGTGQATARFCCSLAFGAAWTVWGAHTALTASAAGLLVCACVATAVLRPDRPALSGRTPA